jgi:hypothetical protein
MGCCTPPCFLTTYATIPSGEQQICPFQHTLEFGSSYPNYVLLPQ